MKVPVSQATRRLPRAAPRFINVIPLSHRSIHPGLQRSHTTRFRHPSTEKASDLHCMPSRSNVCHQSARAATRPGKDGIQQGSRRRRAPLLPNPRAGHASWLTFRKTSTSHPPTSLMTKNDSQVLIRTGYSFNYATPLLWRINQSHPAQQSSLAAPRSSLTRLHTRLSHASSSPTWARRIFSC